MSAARLFPLAGFVLAVASAASFALSGIFASALISAGWSPGAATTARLCCATVILAIPTLLMLRGQWRNVRAAWRQLLLFGLLAVAGCQLAFFLAIQFIPPSLALLIEFMGPVVLMLWLWARTRVAPAALTLVGALIAVAGLVAISGVIVGGSLHPLGIAFALIAAIGNAAFYATGASSDHGIAPIPFVGLGLGIGAVILALVSSVGLLPFTITAQMTTIAGTEVSPVLIVAGMVLISTVLSYILGVAASRRLGATVASFTGYAEPLFGIVWTIVLLAVVPTATQWIGAILIVIGVVTVKLGEFFAARRRAMP